MDPMDASRKTVRPDVVLTESSPRPTPAPARVAFADVMAAGANGLANGAQVALSAIPGSAVTAAAVRGGGGSPMTPMSLPAGGGVSPEGPGAGITSSGGLGALGTTGAPTSLGGVGSTGTGTSSSDPTGMNSTLQQSANLNIYYLQLQMQVDGQNRAFTAQSNMLKAEHDGAKNAIGNIHS
jgi:hypothetical protein